MQKEKGPITVLWPKASRRKEKALLVGVQTRDSDENEIEDSLVELRQLAKTAGASIEQIEIVKRDSLTPNLYIGGGKADEIARICQTTGIDLVIFDNDLSPAQIKNLQDLFGVKVIDRTELILDIFAIHAHSREGKIQVELAQLQYMMPRLVHAWSHLSRQWGGIGTRGPGERQLEIDRRRIKLQITKLKDELERVHGHRQIQRKRREKVGIPLIAVIGYTNAGKTTLFNRLTNSRLPAEDKLFTTLDPRIKRVFMPETGTALFSDTVGFIRKLPHHLVESFKATLEEVYEADILLHVLDANGKNTEQQFDVVMNLLKELDVASKPIVTAINKIDLLGDNLAIISRLHREIPYSVPISARDGNGVEELVKVIQKELIAQR